MSPLVSIESSDWEDSLLLLLTWPRVARTSAVTFLMSSCLVFVVDFLSVSLRPFEAVFFLGDFEFDWSLLESLSLSFSTEALSLFGRVLSVLSALTKGE